MFCKHLAVFTGILALGATLATPAMAHQLTAATATSMNCTGFCLQLAADQLTPGDQDKITYTHHYTHVDYRRGDDNCDRRG